MSEEANIKPFYNRVTIVSDDRVDVTKLAQAVKKFGTVVSVSSGQQHPIWDD